MLPNEPDPLPEWTSKWLVGLQLPFGPKTEIRLYDCNLFKTVLLVIYRPITNLYRRKIFTF